MDRVDAAVIGAGVVGLAVARALAQRGIDTLVLESGQAIGTGISSRNSEVVHAGIYYPTGSLKARLCVQGRSALYDYCAERGVAHRRVGKLIVATHASQREELLAIQRQAIANGVDDLSLIDGASARELEPALTCDSALLSPSTGIVDSHALMLALQGDLERAGGVVALGSKVESIETRAGEDHLLRVAEMEIAAGLVVNAAGLSAPWLAQRTSGLGPAHRPTGRFAKGSYFSLGARAPFSRLIYPVPEPGGLGVHLTLDLAGRARFGPDVQWLDVQDESAIDYRVDPARAQGFYAAIRRYWPALPDGALHADYSGVRPKLDGPGAPSSDFRIDGPRRHGIAGLINLLGIESPGLTSCLAIGEHVAMLAAQA